MSSKSNRNAKNMERGKELLESLYEQFPKCFSKEHPQVLRIGIAEELRPLVEAPSQIFRNAMWVYTHRFEYLSAFETQEYRIGVNGEPCTEQPITSDARDDAKKRLQEKKETLARLNSTKRNMTRSEQAEEQARAKPIYNKLASTYPKSFNKNKPLPLHFATVIEQLKNEQQLSAEQISIALKWWTIRWEYKKAFESRDALYDVHGKETDD